MNNKEIVQLYLKIASQTRAKLTSMSVIVIGVIIANHFFDDFLSIGKVQLLKWSFILFLLTISFEILSGYAKARHYALYLDGKSKSIDYRTTFSGKLSEFLFWLSLVLFIAATTIFIYIVV